MRQIRIWIPTTTKCIIEKFTDFVQSYRWSALYVVSKTGEARCRPRAHRRWAPGPVTARTGTREPVTYIINIYQAGEHLLLILDPRFLGFFRLVIRQVLAINVISTNFDNVSMAIKKIIRKTNFYASKS